MAKRRGSKIVAAAALALALTAPAAAENPPASATCAAGSTAALVTVHGFKDRRGRLRLQNYRGTPEEFLASGRYLHREEVSMPASGDVTLCLPLPGPGSYAIVALHDRDANGKLSLWSDGVGFSRNPRLKLAKPKPEATLISFPAGVTPVKIVLNYRRGLSVKPLQAASTPVTINTASQHRLDKPAGF